MFEVDAVTVRYGNVAVLRDISLHVERGTFCAVLGPAGAGKSALLRLVSGDVLPSRGTISRNVSVAVFEEPSGGGRATHRFERLRAMHRLTERGITVFAELRDLDGAARLADRVVLMRDGRIAAHGTPDVVLQPLLLTHVFGVRCALSQPVAGGRLSSCR